MLSENSNTRCKADAHLSSFHQEYEKYIYDLLKKYKLASSEGLNKHTNRMIRFNTMKDFVIRIPETMSEAEASLLKRLKQSCAETVSV